MEKNNIEIKPMTIENLSSIKDILTQEFDDFWTYSILEQELNSSSTTYIIASQGNEIVGFAGFLKVVDEANIMNIVTKKSKRNIGIGSLLLQSLIQLSKEQKMTSITLEVNENNIPAINLYKKFQFEQVGIRKKYYDNTDSAILMTLYL